MQHSSATLGRAEAARVLGVAADADADAVRAAFKRAARALHPDRHAGDAAATARMQRAVHAYEVLSGRRPAGPESESESGAGQGAGAGAGAGLAAAGGVGVPACALRTEGPPPDNVVGVQVSLERFATGTRLTVAYSVDYLSAGNGPPTASEREVATVWLPAGAPDGVRFRLRGGGHVSGTGERGDVVIEVRAVPHPFYVRRGPDLFLGTRTPPGDDTTFAALDGTTLAAPAGRWGRLPGARRPVRACQFPGRGIGPGGSLWVVLLGPREDLRPLVAELGRPAGGPPTKRRRTVRLVPRPRPRPGVAQKPLPNK